jgi:hypothetical protein
MSLTPTAKGNMLAPAMLEKWPGERAMLAMLPTPRASDAWHGPDPTSHSPNIKCVAGIIGSQPLLILVEWMMGFPTRWLAPASPPMATHSRRKKRS